MSTKIEFHLLQSFPPANLNRDDTNAPKDCEFGGVRRARISSQCTKRTIRLHPDFARATGIPPADRTRLLADKLMKALKKTDKPEEEAKKVATEFTSNLLGGMDTKNPEQSKVLFFISAVEISDIVNRLTADWEQSLSGKFDEILKEYRKTFTKRIAAPDIALFGRMLADDPSLKMDAACQVAHAISTHRVNMETDFFTAVDDLTPEDQTGAAMMSVVGFNSATFYRYAAIDWDLLVSNLDKNAELACATVMGFLRASVKAIPTGKQNSFAAQTPPGLVMIVVRDDGQAWSLVNAFEKPIAAPRKEGGYLEPSIQALIHQWVRLDKVYGDQQRPAKLFVLALDENINLSPLSSEESLYDLEQKVAAALPKE